ncbi:VOC family protein [Pontibacter sp. KCTC 32443]|uniref:VOC family protein n=1 Tax=Pontibacter TaxID=323449 RepID=UPI00164D5AD8|nr:MULTISPECIES: VOC family protein [Pontibacter]MBC5774663.1 VOC family protein [Pontibacter sp. KCTC 32443]
MIEQKIRPCLWFNNEAEDAAKFYTSIFRDSKIGKIAYYGEGAPMPKGTVLTVSFLLEGQEFTALNGGPNFIFSPAISFVVNCQTQDEIDYYWEKLSADPAQEQCGWLKDKFGVSWQIVPEILDELMSAQDQQRSERVMQALLQMKKLVISDLVKAAENQWTSAHT